MLRARSRLRPLRLPTSTSERSQSGYQAPTAAAPPAAPRQPGRELLRAPRDGCCWVQDTSGTKQLRRRQHPRREPAPPHVPPPPAAGGSRHAPGRLLLRFAALKPKLAGAAGKTKSAPKSSTSGTRPSKEPSALRLPLLRQTQEARLSRAACSAAARGRHHGLLSVASPLRCVFRAC